MGLILQAYDFTVKHKAGIKNQNADTFSRMVPVNMALTEDDYDKENNQ